MGSSKGGSSYDPRIGEAALLSAQTGESYMKLMSDQADITNQWAQEDRNRYKSVYEPRQDNYIENASNWDSSARLKTVSNEAGATVQKQMQQQAAAQARQAAAQGIDPGSGRATDTATKNTNATALAVASAKNQAVDQARTEALTLQGNAINMGSGLAVNPLSSISTSNSAYNTGASAAQSGYSTAMKGYSTLSSNATSASNGLWSGVGSLLGAGMGLAFSSDENVKENKTAPKRSSRSAIDNMPIEEWDYKDGAGDGGHHIGPYAQDFKRETGMGNGRSINVIDAIGTTMAATKEISGEVHDLAKQVAKLSANENEQPKAQRRARSI